jgi:DNA repair exonuclease SbcCD nuclease subunit
VEVILFNDLHLADNPPGLRKEGYLEEGLSMLNELVEMAKRERASLVTSGDLFNLKNPAKNSLTMLGQVMDIIRPINRLFVVAGNHDMNTRGHLDGQPLQLLMKAGVVVAMQNNGYQLNGVNVVARRYNMERDTDPTYYQLTDDERGRFKALGGPVLMVAHGSIVPNGAIRPYPHLEAGRIDTTGIHVLASGHIHENLDITKANEDTLFMNLGSLGRVAHTEDNQHRIVQVAGFEKNDRGGLDVTPYALTTALPGDQIFNEPATPKEGASRTEIEQFVARLSSGLQMEYVDISTIVKTLHLSPGVERRILHYLEEVGG